jgi:hypothetical protein
MCLHGISRLYCRLQWLHHRDSSHDLVLALISQHLQRCYVVCLAFRLLEYPPVVRYYDCVGSDDYGRLAALLIINLGSVDVMRFGGGGFEDVVQRAERVV